MRAPTRLSVALESVGALEVELLLADDDHPRRSGPQCAGETLGDAGDGEAPAGGAEVGRRIALHVGRR